MENELLSLYNYISQEVDLCYFIITTLSTTTTNLNQNVYLNEAKYLSFNLILCIIYP
jgi:hypothetical protein